MWSFRLLRVCGVAVDCPSATLLGMKGGAKKTREKRTQKKERKASGMGRNRK